MNRIIFITVFFLLIVSIGHADIVNNSGSTPADSIAIPFYLLDSAGNMIAIASGDSVYVRMFYPSGAVSYSAGGGYNDAKITSTEAGGSYFYSWKEAVETIDGTPVNGVYAYCLLVKDQTGATLSTPFVGTFQLYMGADFNMLNDSLRAISNDNGLTAAKIATAAIDADAIATDAIGSPELAATAAQEIADTILNDTSSYASINTLIDSLMKIPITDTITGNYLMTKLLNYVTNTLKPTTPGRTIDISETGNAGVDFDNAAGKIDSNEFAAETVEKITKGVLDYELTPFGDSTSGELGYYLFTAGDTAGFLQPIALWNVLTSETFASGSLGERIKNNLDGTISGIDDNPWDNATRTLTSFSFTVGLADGEYTKIADTVGEVSAPTEAEIYAYFTSGSNEDAFKATGFSTHTPVDIWEYANRSLTAFSFLVSLAEGQAYNISDSTYDKFTSGSNEDVFKATGFSTHSVSDIWNESQSGYTTAGTFGYYLDVAVSSVSGGTTLWTNEKIDSVLNGQYRGSGSSANYFGLLSDSVYNLFTYGTNEDLFKASGFSTHTPADVWSYSTRSLSAFAFLVSLADGQFTKISDSVGTLSAPTEADIYSYFISGSNEDPFKADVSNLFVKLADGEATKISDTTLADSLSYQGAGGATAEAIYAYFITGSNEDAFKADTSGLSRFNPLTQTVNVSTVGGGAIVAGSIASGALNGKGDWASLNNILNIMPDDTVSNSLFGVWTRMINDIYYMTGSCDDCFSILKRHTDVDTMFVGVGVDTTGYYIYMKPGQVGGAVPDSTRTIIEP